MAGLTDAQAGKIAEHLKLSPDGPSYEAVRTMPRFVVYLFSTPSRDSFAFSVLCGDAPLLDAKSWFFRFTVLYPQSVVSIVRMQF